MYQITAFIMSQSAYNLASPPLQDLDCKLGPQVKLAYSSDGQASLCSPAQNREWSRRNTGQG